MEENPLKKVLLFDAHADLTFLELKTWRSFLCSMVGANKTYFDHLTEATDGLKMFSEFCKGNNTCTGKNSYPAAQRVSGMVQKMADFHKYVFGDFKKCTDPEGPFADVFKSTDEEFEQIKKKANNHFKEHRKMEKETEKAWKRYTRKNKKKNDLKKLSHLSEEELKRDKNWIQLDQKLNLAYTKYNTSFANEITHRRNLFQQTEELKKEFLSKEKRQLDIMFSLINQTLSKLHQLAPQGLQEVEDLNFEAEKSRPRNMARKNWDAYLIEHTFPEIKDITADCGDSEDDDNTDSDEVSDDEDSNDSVGDGYRGHREVRSLRAPKLTNEERGMNDVLQEILASLDDQLDNTSRSRQGPKDGTTQSCAGVRSETRRRRREAKDARQEIPTSQDHNMRPEFDSSQHENVGVYALKSWDKTNSTEISIRGGMELRQIKPVNANGMAYGYKKNKIGIKKYGFYPADMVALSLKDARRICFSKQTI